MSFLWVMDFYSRLPRSLSLILLAYQSFFLLWPRFSLSPSRAYHFVLFHFFWRRTDIGTLYTYPLGFCWEFDNWSILSILLFVKFLRYQYYLLLFSFLFFFFFIFYFYFFYHSLAIKIPLLCITHIYLWIALQFKDNSGNFAPLCNRGQKTFHFWFVLFQILLPIFTPPPRITPLGVRTEVVDAASPKNPVTLQYAECVQRAAAMSCFG